MSKAKDEKDIIIEAAKLAIEYDAISLYWDENLEDSPRVHIKKELFEKRFEWYLEREHSAKYKERSVVIGGVRVFSLVEVSNE